MVKNLPAIWQTRVRTPGGEEPLEKGMATHSNILAWKIPWTEESCRLQFIGSQRVGHDWTHSLLFFTSLWWPPPEKLIVVLQSLSCVQIFVTPWTAAFQASLSFTIFWSLLKLMLPNISSSVISLSSCLQSFSASHLAKGAHTSEFSPGLWPPEFLSLQWTTTKDYILFAEP